MRKRGQRSFQKSIQNTFFAYAIIPVFVLVVVAFLLSRTLLYASVERNCRRLNERISGSLEALCQSYAAGLADFSAREDVLRSLRAGVVPRSLYEDLYAFVNRQNVRADFFLFDADMKLLGASTTRVPDYLTGNFLGPRARARILLPGQATSMTWQGASGAYGSALLFAARAGEDGFLLFNIPEDKWQLTAAGSGSINVLLTDSLHYVVWATEDGLADAYGRIVPELRGGSGRLEFGRRQLYAEAAGAFGDKINVYTVADTTAFASVFAILGWSLLGLLTLVALMIFWASGRIARDKTKVINQIAQTMDNACRGALSEPLVIDTGDEFEKIANTYNRMCQDIQGLLEDNAEIAREQALSEIKQLEAQFNPHFLFNTLETIKFLVRIDAGQAQLAILKLSDILRYSLAGAAKSVRLTDEMHYADCYLALQKLRFDDQLQYAIEIEAAVGDVIVPKLILQPLVENAIRHGYDAAGKSNVRIRASEARGDLQIDVCDGGAPLSLAELNRVRALIRQKPEETGHVGLYNVHRRVELIYKAPYGVTVFSAPAGNTFRITLPMRPERRERFADAGDRRG